MEILNDGFIKIFTKIDKYTEGLSFKGWLRKVMINASIDYYRKNEKHYNNLDISYAQYTSSNESILDQIAEKDIISSIQKLPPSYRMVFNLFVIEGYKHEEISTQLNISVGTSKSNLAMARNKLKKMLITNSEERIRKEDNGR